MAQQGDEGGHDHDDGEENAYLDEDGPMFLRRQTLPAQVGNGTFSGTPGRIHRTYDTVRHG